MKTKIFIITSALLCLFLLSCNNDEAEMPVGGPNGFYDPIYSHGGWQVTEIPSEGYEITLHKGDYHVSKDDNGHHIEYDTGSYDYYISRIFPQEFPYVTFEKERSELYANNPTQEQIDELNNRWKNFFTIDESHYAPDYMEFNSNGVFSTDEIEKITAIHNDDITVYTEGENNDTMHIFIGATDNPRTIAFFIHHAQKNAYEIFRDYNIVYTGCVTLFLHQKGMQSE